MTNDERDDIYNNWRMALHNIDIELAEQRRVINAWHKGNTAHSSVTLNLGWVHGLEKARGEFIHFGWLCGFEIQVED